MEYLACPFIEIKNQRDEEGVFSGYRIILKVVIWNLA
jgi:hypothetical protein